MGFSAQDNWFTTARRGAEAFCFYSVVGLTAAAVGFVGAVLILTAPQRTTMPSSLPGVAWSAPR